MTILFTVSVRHPRNSGAKLAQCFQAFKGAAVTVNGVHYTVVRATDIGLELATASGVLAGILWTRIDSLVIN